jgi:hypothetical protein
MASRETLERIAENQSRFREANERIEQTAESMQLVGPIPFVCECPTPGCTELVRISLVDYESIRANERRFFVVPGHEEVAVANDAGVVTGEAEDARYVLVDKVGLAGEIAAERYRDLAD